MSNVVYLISSLPSLTLGKASPISLEEFINDAKYQLSDPEFEKLEALSIQQLSASPTLGNMKSVVDLFEDLEADKLEIRKAKQQERTPSVISIPKKAVDKNPLELEKYFMESLWDELTSIESVESFTLTEVFVYKLKLQILERLNSFNTEKGLEILEAVVSPPKEMED